jgi:hypothetical protein
MGVWGLSERELAVAVFIYVDVRKTVGFQEINALFRRVVL